MSTQREYFTNSDQILYIDLQDSKEYTNEIEKQRRDDSDLALKTDLKNPLVIASAIASQINGAVAPKLVDKIFGRGIKNKLKKKTKKKKRKKKKKMRKSRAIKKFTQKIIGWLAQ